MLSLFNIVDVLHASKIILRTEVRKTVLELNEYIGTEQIRRRRGTGDAIGLLKAVGEWYIQEERKLCTVFIDLDKTSRLELW